jgi:hypothetical protein
LGDLARAEQAVIKRVWTVAFLGLTAVLIGAEVWSSTDGNPSTVPWTDYVTRFVPEEVTYALLGALLLWAPYHFWRRYRRREQAKRRTDVEE